MLPNWLYGKSKSKLQEIFSDGSAPADYDQVKAQVNQNVEDIGVLFDNLEANGAVNIAANDMTSQTVLGITFTVGDDGTIAASGTATGNIRIDIGTVWLKKGIPYKITDTLDLSKSNQHQQLIARASSGDWLMTAANPEGTYTPSNDISAIITIAITSGQEVSKTFYPMISIASYNGPYVPYAKTNKELTDFVATKSSEITVNTTNVDSENIARNYVNKSAGVKALVLQAKPKTDLVAGTTYELGTVPSDYLPTLSIGFVKEDVVTSGGLIALIEVSNGKLKLTPRVNNIPASGSFVVSVTYI